VNLRFLEAFVCVARSKSFKAAADNLHTTQAAISSRIATLEGKLGVRLFERDNRSVTLTQRGTDLLPRAERMLDLQREMRAAAGRPREFSGSLRIGVMEVVVHTWLPDLLSAFARAHPKVAIELTSDLSPFLRDELVKGRLDYALLTEAVQEEHFENRLLARMPLCWAAAPSLQLPTGTLRLKDIARHRIITFHKQSIVYRDLMRTAGDERLQVNFFSSLAAMIGMTETGFGIALLPAAVIRANVAAGHLHVLDVEPRPADVPIVASVRTEPASLVAGTFAQMAVEVSDAYLRAIDGQRTPDQAATQPAE
jgi:DNA-binding transcriptional LysR family regulator